MAATLQTRRPSTAIRPPPVTDPPAAAFRLALPWLLASLAMSMLALIGEVPAWTLFVFALCAGWRYLIARRGKGLPSIWVRLIIFVPVASAIVMTYGTNPGATGMLTFLIALLSLKVLEVRSARDFTVVSLLGYFMVLCGFFYNQSLALSLYLCIALLLNTAALIRCHSGGRRAPWPPLRLALGLTVQATPLVILLFVIFPRVEGTFLRRISRGSTGTMGMSEHLNPGSVAALAQSNEHAFRARIGEGVIVPQGELYWRGLVLDVCESSMSWKAGAQIPRTDSGVPASTRPNTHRIEQKITLDPQGERWMFALDRPVGIRASSSVKADLYSTNVLQSRQAIWKTAIYSVVSESNLADTPLSANRLDAYTRLPADVSERIKTLARGWHPPGSSEEDAVRAAMDFFRKGGFLYTLNPGILPTTGALDEFLFNSRHGFCEHYAAAFSTLMRAAGIPARVVIGYQGGEYNYLAGHYNIEQADAHAWSEVWIKGKGWQREDPTAVVAPDRLSLGAQNYAVLAGEGSLSAEARLERLNALNSPGSLRWLVHTGLLAWDTLDQQWNLNVLGFDQDKQQSVFQHFGVDNMSWLTGIALTLAAVFSVLTLGTATMRVVNRGPAALNDPTRRLYERFCRRLASAAGVVRAEAEGPLDYARRASTARPDQADAIRSVTDLYVAARYAPATGSGTTRNPAFTALRDAVRKFRPPRRPA